MRPRRVDDKRGDTRATRRTRVLHGAVAALSGKPAGLAVVIALAALALTSSAGAVRSPTERCGIAGASTLAVLDCTGAPVVASLDRGYQAGQPQVGLSAGGRAAIPTCRASEFVFYAARDWLRLAGKVAERRSLCADYYFSIPPLVSDKTNPRPNQAWRIRALGPRFHAMAEIHWTAWQGWVGETGRTWYDAGVEARRRMDAAGYSVASGDTWAVNEFPSTVRRNVGTARANARAFVRGLYEGDGRAAKGAVFVIGVTHGTNDASLYKSTLKAWIADTRFWVDMDRAVRFWAQEVYGDASLWGVAGTSAVARRDNLNEFLQHAARLGVAAPPRYAAARAFLGHTHTPIANAGWQWPSGLGWTMVSGDQMRHFVSSQTHALRNFAATQDGPDRFGFAWAPNNGSGMPPRTFVAETGALLDRLGAALADSGSEGTFDPGIQACVAAGLDWCSANVEGAAFTTAWRIFSAWQTPAPGTASRGVADLVRTLIERARARYPRLDP
jgi:hypothetical protein